MFLVVLNLVGIFSGILWLFSLVGVAMMFDAPGSEKNLLMRCLVIAWLSHPLCVFLGNILFWCASAATPTPQLFCYTLLNFMSIIVVVSCITAGWTLRDPYFRRLA